MNQNKPKFKWKVIESVEWRNKNFEAGSEIEDTDNSYMRAMAYQGKVQFPPELEHIKK